MDNLKKTVVLTVYFLDLKVLYKLKQGEAVCFNNRRVLHGRKGFQLNGIRHFQVKKILQYIIVYKYVIVILFSRAAI